MKAHQMYELAKEKKAGTVNLEPLYKLIELAAEKGKFLLTADMRLCGNIDMAVDELTMEGFHVTKVDSPFMRSDTTYVICWDRGRESKVSKPEPPPKRGTLKDWW